MSIFWEYHIAQNNWTFYDEETTQFLNRHSSGNTVCQKCIGDWTVEFDFQTMRQKNLESKFERRFRCSIENKEMDQKFIWEFMNGSKRWQSFPPSLLEAMEKAFEKSLLSDETTLKTILNGREISIDFRENKFVFVDTNTAMKIHRFASNANDAIINCPVPKTSSAPIRDRLQQQQQNSKKKTAKTNPKAKNVASKKTAKKKNTKTSKMDEAGSDSADNFIENDDEDEIFKKIEQELDLNESDASDKSHEAKMAPKKLKKRGGRNSSSDSSSSAQNDKKVGKSKAKRRKVVSESETEEISTTTQNAAPNNNITTTTTTTTTVKTTKKTKTEKKTTKQVKDSKRKTKQKKVESEEDEEEEENEPKSGIMDGDGVEKEEEEGEVDPECTEIFDKVYSDGTNVYSAMLNQTYIQNNNNKFFLLQILEKKKDKNVNYAVWFRWGRVGFKGQSSLTQCGSNIQKAIGLFSCKFLAKTNNEFAERENFEKVPGKYDLIKINLTSKNAKKPLEELQNLEEDEKKVPTAPLESKLEANVRHLMETICDLKAMEREVQKMDYDTDRSPLGKITKSQVKLGYQALSIIEKCIIGNKFDAEFNNAVNDYYTRIPHAFGMKVPPSIRTLQQLKNEIQLLETLSEIEIVCTAISNSTKKLWAEEQQLHPLDRRYRNLRWGLETLDKNTETFKIIEEYLHSTHAHTHSSYKMKIKNVYELKYPEEKSYEFKGELGNRKLLWHGSRISNWYGILSQGLRIAPPEAPISGYMFGKGVYFADCSSKSANYTFAEPGHPGLLMLAEVALGNVNDLEHANEHANRLPARKHSVRGVGKCQPDPKDSKTIEDGLIVPCGRVIDTPESKQKRLDLLYNEYIVYDTNQIRERYIVEVDFNYSFDF